MKLENIFENPQRMQKIKWVFYGAMVFFIVLDFIMPRHHQEFFWDKIPGFSSVYGFISCVLIIVVSKALGKKWLQKPENYYDK